MKKSDLIYALATKEKLTLSDLGTANGCLVA